MEEDRGMRSSTVAARANPGRQSSRAPLENALRLFVGPEAIIAAPGDPDNLVDRAPASWAVICWNPSPDVRKSLTREGYARQHRFCVLPSRARARWCLPLAADRTTINGFKLYTPFSPAARLLKAIVTRVGDAGWHGWAAQSVVIASRNPLPIENLVSSITKEPELNFALSLGTPGAFQKLTVQVMRPDGKILGYIKMPMTGRVSSRVCAMKERCSGSSTVFPGFASLFRVCFLRAIGMGPISFFNLRSKEKSGRCNSPNSTHEFLRDLQRCEPTSRPGKSVVLQVARSWNQAASKLGARLQNLGHEALKIATRELEKFSSALRNSTWRFRAVEHARPSRKAFLVRLGIRVVGHAGSVGSLSLHGANGRPLEEEPRLEKQCGHPQLKSQTLHALSARFDGEVVARVSRSSGS